LATFWNSISYHDEKKKPATSTRHAVSTSKLPGLGELPWIHPRGKRYTHNERDRARTAGRNRHEQKPKRHEKSNEKGRNKFEFELFHFLTNGYHNT
jgi:hypothetical protein